LFVFVYYVLCVSVYLGFEPATEYNNNLVIVIINSFSSISYAFCRTA